MVAGGRCPRHEALAEERQVQRQQAFDAQRGTSTERGYDAAWRAVRRQFLEANPKCCELGCGKDAVDVHHVRSVREAPELRLSWGNLRPYCHEHHAAVTARTQGYGKTRAAAKVTP